MSRDFHDPAPDELAGSMLWYPFVGILLGGILAMTDVLLARWLPREAVAALLILVLVAMTRGLHQDGLADTLDGLAGGRTASDRLTIMRDPRIGAIGATGLFLSLILRYGALVSLPEALRSSCSVMHAGHRTVGHGRRRLWRLLCTSRGRPGCAVSRASLGEARPWRDRRRPVSDGAGPSGAVPALAAVLFGGLLSRLATVFYRHFLGGITGDTLGATNELIEVSFVLLMPLLLTLSYCHGGSWRPARLMRRWVIRGSCPTPCGGWAA